MSILPALLTKKQLQELQMKAQVAQKDIKETRSKTETNFSKGKSVLDNFKFCNLGDAKILLSQAKMLSFEVLNLVYKKKSLKVKLLTLKIL